VGRVLVVDDEPQVAVVLNDVLTTLGYVVQVTEMGAGDR
jgi:CheY-like chemotaxis protein